MAKVYWITGELGEAGESQSVALRWLKDDGIVALPRNQERWYFPLGGGEGIKVITRDEKICYAQMALSATLFLERKEADARALIVEASNTCANRARSLKTLLKADLTRVAQEQPTLAGRIHKFNQRYLSN